MLSLSGVYFYGHKISDYGIENGYLDYATLAKAFDAVMYNDFYKLAEDFEVWAGSDYNEETEDFIEFFQFFIVSAGGAEILRDAGETVYYSDSLDMYVWAVSHWGTSWDYVLTDVKCNQGYEAAEA